MKFFTMALLGIICFSTPMTAQSDDVDHYSLNLVQAAVSMRAQGVIMAKVETRLARIGDAASIALLKIFTQDQLKDPQTIESFLPVIHVAFCNPQFIAEESDKKPAITVFLLNFIHQHVSDSRVQEDIRQTLEFVKQKGSESSRPAATP